MIFSIKEHMPVFAEELASGIAIKGQQSTLRSKNRTIAFITFNGGSTAEKWMFAEAIIMAMNAMWADGKEAPKTIRARRKVFWQRIFGVFYGR